MKDVCSHSRRGVTLLEVFVVVLIVGTLVSILIPALRGMMIRKHDAQDLTNLRQTMQDFYAYAAEHKGRLVNAGPPGQIQEPRFYSLESEIYQRSRYRAHRVNWPQVLGYWREDKGHRHFHSSYADFLVEHEGRLVDPLTVDPNYPIYLSPTDYEYGMPLLTRSEIWTDPGAQLSEEAYAANFDVVSLDNVKHPSRKGALAHRERPGDKGLWHVGFLDGSAALKHIDAARPPAIKPRSGDGAVGLPVFATLHGFKGMDF